MKSITLNQDGWIVGGVARIQLYNEQIVRVNMDKNFIPLNDMSKETLLKCVNDGKYGCEKIIEAQIVISESYTYQVQIHRKTITINHPRHTKYFGKRGI